MNEKSLAWKYGDAVYHARRWQRKAEILLQQIEALALEDAEIDPPAAVQAGDIPNQPEDVSPAANAPVTIPHYVVPLADLSSLDIRKGAKYFGLLTRVGHSLGIHRTGVYKVATGRVTSELIMQELVAERRRIDLIQRVETPPLTAEENSQFCWGGRYCGLLEIVAKKLNVSVGHVSHIRLGDFPSARVLKALRSEMARVDAELAAKKAAQL